MGCNCGNKCNGGCRCNRAFSGCCGIPPKIANIDYTCINRNEFVKYKTANKEEFEKVNEELEKKQGVLTAGANITISDDNEISATTGTAYTAGDGINITNDEISVDEAIVATKTDLDDYYTKAEVDAELNTKQDTLTAGNNITIDATTNTISSMQRFEVGAEVKIGEWVEGGTTYDIYRKVIDFGALPNASDKDVPHDITDVVKFINLYAIADDGVNIRPIPFTSGTALTSQITLYANRTNVHIHAGTDRSTETAYVVLEYLKNQS